MCAARGDAFAWPEMARPLQEERLDVDHLWAVTFNEAAPTKRLLALEELQVKGWRCVVVDP
ncbi:hypothetical protein HPB50_029244 [Hyalomma asiaticum]|nr:hypothetical protein HPB50_029244 [Hyalomma asiaticum]